MEADALFVDLDRVPVDNERRALDTAEASAGGRFSLPAACGLQPRLRCVRPQAGAVAVASRLRA